MANFRRWFLTLAVLLLTAGLASSQVGTAGGSGAGPLSCTASPASTPQLRAEGFTELLGDLLITCTGGPRYAPGAPIPTTTITVYVLPNRTVTSRLFDNTTNASDALLLIDEPGSGLATGATGGFGPQAPQILCGNLTSGCPAYVGVDGSGSYDVATATQPTAGTGFAATSDFNNVYQGRLNVVGSNTVTFFGVPVLPPINPGVSRVFRITNIRIPTAGLDNGISIQVSVSASPSLVLPVSGFSNVGVVLNPGLNTRVDPAPAGGQNPFSQCAAPTGPMLSAKLHFQKGFAPAFKTRTVPQSDTPWASTMPTASQNIPGGLYNGFASISESGFVFPALMAANSSVAGLADYGSRLKAVFTNIPAGVVLYVSTSSGASPAVPGGTAKTSYAVLMATDQSHEADSDGAGLTPLTSTVMGSDGLPAYLLPISGGAAAAIWEVVNSNPNAVDELAFSVYVSYTPGAPTAGFPGGTPMTGVPGAPLNDVALSFAPEPGGGTFSTSNGPTPLATIVPRYQVVNPSHGSWVSIADCPEAITQLVPNNIGAGSVAFTLTINGANFVPTDQVYWSAPSPVALATTYLNSSQLQATVPSSLVVSAGAATVQVQSVLATSNSSAFAIFGAPKITTASPAAIAAGSVAQTLTIQGSGFVQGAVASWGGAALTTTYVDGADLTAALPAGMIATSGAFILSVSNPGGLASTNSFTIRVNPVLSSVAPSAAPAGGTSVTITASGMGFTSSDVVGITIGSTPTPLTTTYVNATTLTAVVPQAVLASAASATLAVSDSGTSTASGQVAFAISLPQITQLTPAAIDAGSAAFTLNVAGSMFAPTAAVRWNGTALTTTYVDSSHLTAAVSATLVASAGSANVTVANPNVNISTQVSFTITVAPVVTSIAPTWANAGGASFTLTANGTGFDATTALQWNGTPLATTFVGATQVTAPVPASSIAVAGSASITALTQSGSASNALTLTIRPAAAVSTLSPSSLPAGGVAFTLTINGANFVSGAVADWGATPLSTTFVSAARITALVPAALIGAAGHVPVSVSNPGGSVSATADFVVSIAIPTISSLNPFSTVAGGAAFTVTINGANFDSSSVAQWNNAMLPTTFVSGAQLTAAVAAFAVASPGSATITVLSQGVVSNGLQLSITAGSVLSGLSPQSANAGDSGFTLTLSGSYFFAGSTVTWNGTPLSTTYFGATQLTATVPANLIASAGQVLVAVSYPGGGSSNSLQFNVIGAAPTVSSLSPTSAVAGGPGFTLMVTGSNFDPSVSVHWNGAPLPTAFSNSTQVSASVSAGLIASSGTATITVATSNGVASNSIQLPIHSGPAITSLIPSSVPAGGPDFILTINGSNFVSGAIANWNGAQLTTTFLSATQLNAAVAASRIASPGSVTITIVNPDRTASAPFYMQIGAQAPVITFLSPASITAGSPGVSVTINGSGFLAASTVAGFAGATTTFISPTQLVVAVPGSLVAACGTMHVSVTNPGATSNSLDFAVTAAVPTVSGYAPSTAVAGGPAFTLTINGANFDSAATVAWNTQSLSTTVVNSGRVTAVVPSSLIAATGSVWVAVVNPGGVASAMVPFAITPPPPTTGTASILNAASSLPAIAPGSLISIYGSSLATDSGKALTLPLPDSLAGTSVTINGIAAPLLFVSPGQINAQVPYAIKPGTANLVIQTQGQQSAPINFQVTATGPGIFTQPGGNQALAVNLPSGTMNTAQNPVKPGQYVTAYAIGQGMLDNPVDTGCAAPDAPYSCPLAAVSATLGGMPVDIQFAGLPPGYAGLMQLNLLIPALPPGQQQLIVTIGGVTANTTIITVGQ